MEKVRKKLVLNRVAGEAQSAPPDALPAGGRSVALLSQSQDYPRPAGACAAPGSRRHMCCRKMGTSPSSSPGLRTLARCPPRPRSRGRRLGGPGRPPAAAAGCRWCRTAAACRVPRRRPAARGSRPVTGTEPSNVTKPTLEPPLEPAVAPCSLQQAPNPELREPTLELRLPGGRPKLDSMISRKLQPTLEPCLLEAGSPRSSATHSATEAATKP